MFYLHTLGGMSTPPMEYMPVDPTTAIVVGMAMTMQEGKLVAAGGTAAPTYICMAKKSDDANDNLIAVIRVQHEHVYATALATQAPDLAIGDKLSILTGGLMVMPGEGAAEVVGIEGTNAMDTVYVRF